MNTLIREIYEWIYSIVIALAIAMVIHIFVVQPTRVSGESMVPTLHNGEYLVVEKWDHILGREPDYGDYRQPSSLRPHLDGRCSRTLAQLSGLF